MKRFVLSNLLVLAVAVPGTCFGAAAVSLNNYDSGNPIFYLTSGVIYPRAGCYVEIYAGSDAESAVPLTSTTDGSSVFALDHGFFDGGIGNIPELADNAMATFVAHAWLGANTVDGWRTALDVAGATWTQATGANTPPNLPAPAALNIPSMIIYSEPEPATWALGLLGAAILFFGRRRLFRSQDHST